mgnify:CR=1 FL=1
MDWTSPDGAIRLIRGDCLQVLPALDRVDLVFGSPPYEDARTYGIEFCLRDEDWVAWMTRVVRASLEACRGLVGFVVEGRTRNHRWSATPALLMADLHRAGVHLRKPPLYRRDGIPGSGGPDWLKNHYEFIVCATNGGRLPWSDNTAMGHPCRFKHGGAMSNRHQDGTRNNAKGAAYSRERRRDGTRQVRAYYPPPLANPGNIIDCGAGGGGQLGSDLAHENEAPFPEALAEFFIRSFCPPGGTVLDPFSGSGTTVAVAHRFGRRAIGIDIRESQIAIAKRRVEAELERHPLLDSRKPGDIRESGGGPVSNQESVFTRDDKKSQKGGSG